MSRVVSWALTVVVTLGVAGPAAGGTGPFEVRLGVGILAGDTTYSIGGSIEDNRGYRGTVWDPLSELRWPLDAWMVSLGGRARFGRFSAHAAVSKNATSHPGDLQDSDWGVYYGLNGGDPNFSPATKDIYSTSSTTLDALIVDVGGRYDLLRRERFSAALGVGLRYQKFSFVGSDVIQYSPSWNWYGLSEDPFAGEESGRVIEYEVTYVVPYAEISGRGEFNRMFALEGALGYSPRAIARDRDDHLLRSKLNTGDGRGSAWLFEVALRCRATEHWFGTLGVSGLFVRTSGSQRQEFYAGESVGEELAIDQDITSSQISGALEVGYAF